MQRQKELAFMKNRFDMLEENRRIIHENAII